ncbi:hypothetical protein C8R46DRAFT_1050065 [Mycena filopes]|nr:hypothetical protein C8R46DRAFT_1050065 [Mycena filopes]
MSNRKLSTAAPRKRTTPIRSSTRNTPSTSPAPMTSQEESSTTPARSAPIIEELTATPLVETPTPGSRTGARPSIVQGMRLQTKLAQRLTIKVEEDESNISTVDGHSNVVAQEDSVLPDCVRSPAPSSPSRIPITLMVIAAHDKIVRGSPPLEDASPPGDDEAAPSADAEAPPPVDKGKGREDSTSPFLVPVGTVAQPRVRSRTSTVEEIDYDLNPQARSEWETDDPIASTEMDVEFAVTTQEQRDNKDFFDSAVLAAGRAGTADKQGTETRRNARFWYT